MPGPGLADVGRSCWLAAFFEAIAVPDEPARDRCRSDLDAGSSGHFRGKLRHGDQAIDCGIVRDQALIPLNIVPAQVTFVMLDEQDLPVGADAPDPRANPFAPGFDADFAAGSPEHIGAGVDRVGENVVHRVVDGLQTIIRSAARV